MHSQNSISPTENRTIKAKRTGTTLSSNATLLLEGGFLVSTNSGREIHNNPAQSLAKLNTTHLTQSQPQHGGRLALEHNQTSESRSHGHGKPRTFDGLGTLRVYVCVCLYVEETRKGQRLRGRAGSHSTRGTGKRETRKANKTEPTVSTSRNGMNCTQRHEREVGPSIGRPASPSNPTACACVCVWRCVRSV